MEFARLKLEGITPTRLMGRCEKIRERGAAAPAVQARDIVLQIYRFVQARGLKVDNPAEVIRPSAIARFKPRDRALTPAKIHVFFKALESAYVVNAASGRQVLAAHNGAQVGIYPRQVGGGRLQCGALDDSERPDEGRARAQCLGLHSVLAAPAVLYNRKDRLHALSRHADDALHALPIRTLSTSTFHQH